MCCTCQYFRPYRHSEESRPHDCDFVDAPFGTASLRLDCGDHQPAVEIVHLGTAPDRISEAEEAGVTSVPAMVADGKPCHINFGASLADLKSQG